MEEDYIRVINITVFGVISWGLIFILLRRIFSNYSFDFSTRIVSALHATVAVVLATLTIQDWSCPVCPTASTSTIQQMETMAFSLSYMIYDLICSHFDQVISIDNAVHHSICILGFVTGLCSRECGSEIVAALWIGEISTPFLNLRVILKEIGYRDTDLNLAVDKFSIVGNEMWILGNSTFWDDKTS
ncbi:hypothetical protein YC2023_024878 [Brassica napus]